MPVVAQPAERVRFGDFEANLAIGELRKRGVRIKLHDQPFQILAMLVARPGEMLTREEIQKKLWPAGTFVDFENGMNRAINRLRDALGDSAVEPKFIETVPRHGYRFLVSVERVSGEVPAAAEATTPPRLRFGSGWHWIGVGLAAALVVSALAGWRLHAVPKKALNFGPRDWVLVTNFENRTGNPVFDGSVEYALARELSNSQYVTVVSPERASDALRLMRKPPDTRIDAALGREVCLRDGGIRAMLTGRVEKLGTVYVLSAQLVDPVRGVAVASLSEEDPGDTQIAAAVRRLSNRVRERLGETRALIQQSDKQLEKVTTPSLHALQLYTRADELMRTNWDTEIQTVDAQAAAAELLKQALADDPNFASAHLLLAYTYGNRTSCQSPGCSPELKEKARPEFQRAFDLAYTTSDRERLFIQATYYGAVQKDLSRNAETLEALLQLYPDHFWAANNLEDIYEDYARWDDVWKPSVRIADLRPDDRYSNSRAACGLYLTKNLDAALPYLERVRGLSRVEPNGPGYDDFAETLPIIDSWSRGDVTKARSQYLQVQKLHKDFSYPPFLWSIGELAEAGKERQSNSGDLTDVNLGLVSYIKGDVAAAKRYLQMFAQTLTPEELGQGGTPMVVMVRSGLSEKVEKAIRTRPQNIPIVQIVKGELAIAHGRTKEGVTLLEKGLDGVPTLHAGSFYLGSETLARTYAQQGDYGAALRTLQRAVAAKGKDCPHFGPVSGGWWLRNELQLADIYRKMGRILEAEQVENELRKMLIYADPDHPIVLALKKREQLSSHWKQGIRP